MDGKQKDARYERWLARAAGAYQRMFGGKSHEELVTLTEREDMAVCLGKELAAFLLEEHVGADPAKSPRSRAGSDSAPSSSLRATGSIAAR